MAEAEKQTSHTDILSLFIGVGAAASHSAMFSQIFEFLITSFLSCAVHLIHSALHIFVLNSACEKFQLDGE